MKIILRIFAACPVIVFYIMIFPQLLHAELTLCQKGKTDYTIVLSQKASLPERFAAGELRKYLKKICGADFPVTDTGKHPEGPMILIGTPESNPLIKSLDDRVQFSARECEFDSFFITTIDQNLILAGANSRSCLYVVYGFLEDDLGVFWPSVFGQEEKVPVKTTIVLGNINRKETASFKYRGYTSAEDLRKIDQMAKMKMNLTGVPYELCDNQRRWNQLLPELQKRGIKIYSSQHGFHYFLPPKEFFKDHPEYYALRPVERQGKKMMERVPKQFCTSNQEALNIYVERFIGFMRRHPEIDLFCPGPNDGYDWCMCPNCGGDVKWAVYQKKQFASDRLMRVVNAVASMAFREFPHKRIIYFGYVAGGQPPEKIKPLPNVISMLAFFEHSGADLTSKAPYRNCTDICGYYRESIAQWQKLTPEVIIYEYYCGRASESAQPFVRTTNMANSLRYLAEKGVQGVISQALYNWWRPYLTNNYLLGKLLWNVKADPEHLLENFCEKRYGKSAGAMLAYFRHLDAGDLRAAGVDLEQAEQLATNESISRMIKYQQLFFKWRCLNEAINEKYQEIIETCKDAKSGKAVGLLNELFELERQAQIFIDNTGICGIIDLPAAFHKYPDIIRKKYNLEKQKPLSEENIPCDRNTGILSSMDNVEGIGISANPPLPVKNFVRNPGFELNPEFPAGEGCGLPIPGWQTYYLVSGDGITDESPHSGRFCLKLSGCKPQTETKLVRQRNPLPSADGSRRMMLYGWSKPGNSKSKGSYLLVARSGKRNVATLKFDKNTHDWQYAEQGFMLPGDSPVSDIAIYYANQPDAYFDDIFLGPGETEMTVKVSLPNLKNVVLTDGSGNQIFNSGLLPEGLQQFRKTVKVSTRKNYIVHAECVDGSKYRREYPPRDRRIDLAELYNDGKLKVDTNMKPYKQISSGKPFARVFDNSLAFDSNVCCSDEFNPAFFKVVFNKPEKVSRIGICLKPYSLTNATLSVKSKGEWKIVKNFEYALTNSVEIIQLPQPEPVEAVNIENSSGVGLKCLTELQIFELNGE